MYNREIFRTVTNIRDQNGRSKSKSLDFKQLDNNYSSMYDSKQQIDQLRNNINNLEYKNIHNTIDDNIGNSSKNYFFRYDRPNIQVENDQFKPRLEKSIKKDDRITYYNEKNCMKDLLVMVVK